MEKFVTEGFVYIDELVKKVNELVDEVNGMQSAEKQKEKMQGIRWEGEGELDKIVVKVLHRLIRLKIDLQKEMSSQGLLRKDGEVR